ncbi:Sugar ABC superfamily ATP binding cassette transporter, solute-binding component, partial [human gut metagenome]
MALNRRLFLTLAGASTVTATLAACAGGGSGSQGDEGTGTIQFWSNHPGSSKDLEQAMIDAWNKANPDSPAELVTAGSSYEELAQKFNAALSGGDLP